VRGLRGDEMKQVDKGEMGMGCELFGTCGQVRAWGYSAACPCLSCISTVRMSRSVESQKVAHQESI
jgi:hypothetical protein